MRRRSRINQDLVSSTVNDAIFAGVRITLPNLEAERRCAAIAKRGKSYNVLTMVLRFFQSVGQKIGIAARAHKLESVDTMMPTVLANKRVAVNCVAQQLRELIDGLICSCSDDSKIASKHFLQILLKLKQYLNQRNTDNPIFLLQEIIKDFKGYLRGNKILMDGVLALEMVLDSYIQKEGLVLTTDKNAFAYQLFKVEWLVGFYLKAKRGLVDEDLSLKEQALNQLWQSIKNTLKEEPVCLDKLSIFAARINSLAIDAQSGLDQIRLHRTRLMQIANQVTQFVENICHNPDKWLQGRPYLGCVGSYGGTSASQFKIKNCNRIAVKRFFIWFIGDYINQYERAGEKINWHKVHMIKGCCNKVYRCLKSEPVRYKEAIKLVESLLEFAVNIRTIPEKRVLNHTSHFMWRADFLCKYVKSVCFNFHCFSATKETTTGFTAVKNALMHIKKDRERSPDSTTGGELVAEKPSRQYRQG